MKKPTRALGAGLAVLAACAAQAQPLPRPTPNVTLYGLLDTGVERLDNVGAARGSLMRMPFITGSLPSRLGFRGAEDLGGGLYAQFVLEMGIAPDSGSINQGGRGFGRQAFVGLTDRWGTLSFGRQYSNFFLALGDSGIFGPNIYGLPSLDPYIGAARFDNTVAYTGDFGPLGVAANYSLGRDVVPTGGTSCAGESVTDKQACRAWSVMAKYVTQGWGVATGFERQHGGAGAAGGLTNSNLTDSRLAVNGFVRGGNWKLAGGLIRRDNEGNPVQPRSDLWYLEGSYAVTPATSVDALAAQLRYQDSPRGDRARLLALRATYKFSRRTAVYATWGHINNHGASAVSVSSGQPGAFGPVAGGSQNGVMLGVRHAF